MITTINDKLITIQFKQQIPLENLGKLDFIFFE